MVFVVAVRRVIVSMSSRCLMVFVFFGFVVRNVVCVLSVRVRGVRVLLMENAELNSFPLNCSFCFYRDACLHHGQASWITCYHHFSWCNIYKSHKSMCSTRVLVDGKINVRVKCTCSKCNCGYVEYAVFLRHRLKVMAMTKTKLNQKEGGENVPDMKEYSKGKGVWISAEDVEIGDQLDVLDAGEMTTIEDKEYLALPIKLPRKDEERKVRLGSKNVARIIKGMGNTNTERWVHGKLEVVDIEDYGQMGKGIIFRGIPPQKATEKPREKEDKQTPPDAQQLAKKLRELSPEERTAFLNNLARESGAYEEKPETV